MDKQTAILLILMAFGPGKGLPPPGLAVLQEKATESRHCTSEAITAAREDREDPCYAAALKIPELKDGEGPESSEES